jgi:hypothetical protein
MKKTLFYILYLIVIVFAILEVAIRFVTETNKANIEMVLGKSHRYLLPLPSAVDKCHSESIEGDAKNKYRIFHDTLGWSHGSWGQDSTEYPLYANNKGIRITKSDFENRVVAKDKYNIITIGNSFTHSDFVTAEESWPQLIQEKTGRSVANLGVGGYGIHQALLRLMISNIKADTVLFGVIYGDFDRALDPVYTFYQGGCKTKPIFEFEEDSYKLINVPVLKPSEFCEAKQKHTHPIFEHIPGFSDYIYSDSWWTHSYVLRLIVSLRHQNKLLSGMPIYLTNDESLDYCINIFELFHKYCEQNGMYGKVVLLDAGENFRHKELYHLSNPWDLVNAKLEARGIPHVDFHDELYKAFLEKP